MPQSQIQLQTGKQTGTGLINARGGSTGEQVIQQLHGRYYATNYEGALFSDGMTLTAINNVTFALATLGATATPILGVWNPSTSPVNLVILQAVLGITVTAATATGAGPFVWASSVGNTALTLGNTPFNRKSGVATGSYAKGLAGIALTGLTNNLVVRGAAALGGGSLQGYSFVGTAAGAQTPLIANLDNVDGAIIVPPGGVLALLAANTPVAHSAVSVLVWEEVNI